MVAVLEHPPYPIDLIPADFFLFLLFKAAIKGARVADINAIEDRVTAVLQSISQELFVLIVSRSCRNVVKHVL